MASHKLVVEVVCANGLSSSLDVLNPCVELRFTGQSFTTSVKENVRCPVWNETVLFNVVDRERLPSLSLDAYVYNVIDGSKLFLGKVRLSGSTLADSSDEVKDYQLKGGIFQRSKGMLLLKVFLKNEAPTVTSDPLSQVIPFRSLGQPIKEPVDTFLKEINPTFEDGMIIERKLYLFVRVVKARHLPDLDANGRVDPYVKIDIGTLKAVTKTVHREKNPEWNSTFAFSENHLNVSQVARINVVVYDCDMVKDDFVGLVSFDLSDIPKCFPNDKPAIPEWHHLVDESGRPTQGELMLAVWMGSQADDAFLDSWNSDWLKANITMMPHIAPNVYNVPRLWYLRLHIFGFKCIAVSGGIKIVGMDVTAAVGDQSQKTRMVNKPLAAHYIWGEEIIFVAAEPFEDDLEISVKAHIGPGNDKVVGQIAIPLETIQRRINSRPIELERQWFDLQMPATSAAAAGGEDELSLSSCRIELSSCLYGGYNVQYESTLYADDLRPAAKEISDPPLVGLLEVGILSAYDLPPRKRRSGRLTLHPYCVAKYGRRWVRTRTIIENCNPSFHEQYAWDVYDTATVVTVGVFDNVQVDSSLDEEKGDRLGKVKIRLSNLQPGRIYCNAYPLLVLQPSGLKKMGNLCLSVRFTSKSLASMVRMYACPKLPQLHYEHPISAFMMDILRLRAMNTVASRLNRMEPPLPKGVVEYMCEFESNVWSIRRSKVNFFRIIGLLTSFVAVCKWFHYVSSWKNPAITFLVLAVFFLALLFHEFVVPSVLLYVFVITLWRFRSRPTNPPYVDLRLSQADPATNFSEAINKNAFDELDEEFDIFPTSRSFDQVQARYDRLRSIAGRVQTIMGEFATMGEGIYGLTCWWDPMATLIFGVFTLATAVIFYVTPWKVLVAIAGLYFMRPPILRRKTPSFIMNFYRRLPHKKDSLLL